MNTIQFSDRRSYIIYALDPTTHRAKDFVIVYKPSYNDNGQGNAVAWHTSAVGTAYASNNWEIPHQSNNSNIMTFPSYTFPETQTYLAVLELNKNDSLSTIWTIGQTVLSYSNGDGLYIDNINTIGAEHSGWEQGDLVSLSTLNQDQTSNSSPTSDSSGNESGVATSGSQAFYAPSTSTTGEAGENPSTTYGLEYESNYDRDLNTYTKLLEDVADTNTDDVTFTYTPTNPDVNFFAPSKMFDQDRKFITMYNPDGTTREDVDTTETEITYTGIGSIGKPIVSNAAAQTLASQYSNNPHQYLDYLNNPDKYAIDTYLLMPQNVVRFIKAIIDVGNINQSLLVKNVQEQIKEKGD